MQSALVHIYTGEGKGKTTAALGLALRAYGAGMKAQVFQFCKGAYSSEIDALKKLGIPVTRALGAGRAFPWEMDGQQLKRYLAAQRALLEAARAATRAEGLVILDEALGAMTAGAFGEEALLSLIKEKSDGCELVLTGRGATQRLIEAAGYVTEMRALKHPYSWGVSARKGIEY